MRRLLPVLLLVPLLCLLAAPRPAMAGTVTGGALNAPGEKSHNIGLGWPEVFYVWEGLTREKYALGVRVGVQIWPLAFHVGFNARITLKEEGRVALALLVVPSFNFAAYGGTRGSYPNNYQWGRSRTFLPSLGPGVNLGVLAAIDVSPVLDLLVTLENPLAFWIWTHNGGFWLEWPITITAGLEYEVNYSTSLFGRLGAGPAISFGKSQLLGYHWHAHIGVQLRY